jgi:hypothetical protein
MFSTVPRASPVFRARSEYRQPRVASAAFSVRVNLFTSQTEYQNRKSVKLCFTRPPHRAILGFVARKRPVPENEKLIGQRLREFREQLMVSQTAFALKAGLSRERLVQYEFGLVPLPWSAGDALCRTHNINQRWLLTGVEPPRALYLKPSDEIMGRARPRSLFSEICREFVADKSRQWAASESLVSVRAVIKAYSDAKKLKSEGKMAPDEFAMIEARMVALAEVLDDIVKKHRLK